MRLIDADALREDCKRYLGTLNPDKDGKECTRIHWLIGVLENAPTIEPEPCEDAISRQRLLNDLKELIVVWGKYPVMAEPIKGIGTAIGYAAAIPSVTPERKMGKWIMLEECANAGYYCSECRKRVVREGWSGTVRKIKFCPNCGADMRSEAEREIE